MLVVAKAPAPGRSKTRLASQVGAATAAALQEAMLLDTLECCRAEVRDTGVLVDDPAGLAALQRLVPPRVPILVQGGRGLGDALRSGVAAALTEARGVALVASDLPGVPPGAVTGALARLRAGADVVLGPGPDGGYWLIALAHAHAAPFRDIPWSTPEVLVTTLDRCRGAGLSVELALPWRDLDTVDDLHTLARDADHLPGARTARLLASLRASFASIPVSPDLEEVPAP